MGLWLWQVLSLHAVWQRLGAGLPVDQAILVRARRRAIHLPWFAAIISIAAWLSGIPVFLLSLAQMSHSPPTALLWHLAISFCVSTLIVVTNTFFLVELTTQWLIFPALFRDARADLTPGVITLSLRGRGLLWAISASICPIVALLLLNFAPVSSGSDALWFSLFVGGLGIASGLGTAVLVSRLVAKPIDDLRAAAQAVAQGQFDLQLPVTRADEFGLLLGEFNHMTRELKDKERLRETFGLHVGERAADQILARDPGLGGTEQEISVMFVDIRSFTTLAESHTPHETLEVLNEFLCVAVRVVEQDHGGMINKYLGDGFMALFGVGAEATTNHAQDAFEAGRGILREIALLNEKFFAQKRSPLRIGIGIHTGAGDCRQHRIPGATRVHRHRRDRQSGGAESRALTKQAKTPLLLTAACCARLSERSELIELPPLEVRGLDEPVTVFALQIRQEAAK